MISPITWNRGYYNYLYKGNVIITRNSVEYGELDEFSKQELDNTSTNPFEVLRSCKAAILVEDTWICLLQD